MYLLLLWFMLCQGLCLLLHSLLNLTLFTASDQFLLTEWYINSNCADIVEVYNYEVINTCIPSSDKLTSFRHHYNTSSDIITTFTFKTVDCSGSSTISSSPLHSCVTYDGNSFSLQLSSSLSPPVKENSVMVTQYSSCSNSSSVLTRYFTNPKYCLPFNSLIFATTSCNSTSVIYKVYENNDTTCSGKYHVESGLFVNNKCIQDFDPVYDCYIH